MSNVYKFKVRVESDKQLNPALIVNVIEKGLHDHYPAPATYSRCKQVKSKKRKVVAKEFSVSDFEWLPGAEPWESEPGEIEAMPVIVNFEGANSDEPFLVGHRLGITLFVYDPTFDDVVEYNLPRFQRELPQATIKAMCIGLMQAGINVKNCQTEFGFTQ